MYNNITDFPFSQSALEPHNLCAWQEKATWNERIQMKKTCFFLQAEFKVLIPDYFSISMPASL